MTRPGTSPAAVYAFSAAICLVAPALGFIPLDVVVWSNILLAGLPVSVMAMLLAGIHAKHRLVDGVYRITAVVWTAAVTLILTPLGLWASSLQRESAIRWVRITATALVILLFVRLTARAWKLPWMERLSLALAFGAVAVFFWSLEDRYIFGFKTTGLEAVTESLAEFFINAVFTCLLLVPGVVTGWVIARRRHDPAAG